MEPDVHASLLLAAARLCAHPPVSACGITIAGEVQWADAARRATPLERRELLRALSDPLLVCTEPGRENMARWIAAGRPPAPTDFGSCLFGDPEGIPVMRNALAYLPDPVAWFVDKFVAFELVGVSSGAWIGPPSGRPLVVRCGPDVGRDARLALHESAHGWDRSPDPGPVLVAAAAWQRQKT